MVVGQPALIATAPYLFFRLTLIPKTDAMSIAKKMRFRAEEALYLLSAPAGMALSFEGAEVKTSLAGKQAIGQVVLFAAQRKKLDELAPKVISRLADEAVFWVAYPKKSGSIKSDITRDHGWDAVMGAGYDPVTQVAIDDEWSALRFRKSEAIGARLRDIPMESRQVEGVDFINRTVTLPKDIEKALKTDRELFAFFNNLSFSHKKEYVTYVVEAKKEETRANRIPKMIANLAKYKAEKERK